MRIGARRTALKETETATFFLTATVDQNKCLKYIGHLRKVMPKVIELHGAATGY